MELFFRKYQFPSEEFYRELLNQTDVYNESTIVELGTLIENSYSVDVLWNNQLPEKWILYEIWDIEGNGIHTFSGWDFTSPNIII
jgi:hypothetical protein